MRELIMKLETFRESKERKDHIQSLIDAHKDKDDKLLAWPNPDEQLKLYSLADFFRHELKFLTELRDGIKIKDKAIRDEILDWLNKNIEMRVNILLGKTREWKMENIIEWDSYTQEDLWRVENYFIGWLDELPQSLANQLEIKEKEEQAKNEAQIQENLDALTDLELEGL